MSADIFQVHAEPQYEGSLPGTTGNDVAYAYDGDGQLHLPLPRPSLVPRQSLFVYPGRRSQNGRGRIPAHRPGGPKPELHNPAHRRLIQSPDGTSPFGSLHFHHFFFAGAGFGACSCVFLLPDSRSSAARSLISVRLVCIGLHPYQNV